MTDITAKEFLLCLRRGYGEAFTRSMARSVKLWLGTGELPRKDRRKLLWAIAREITAAPSLARIRKVASEAKLLVGERYRASGNRQCTACAGTGWVETKPMTVSRCAKCSGI